MAGLAISMPITGVDDIMLCVHALQAPAWGHLMNSFELSHNMYTMCQYYPDADWHTQAGFCRQAWSTCIRISIGIQKLAMCHDQGKLPVLGRLVFHMRMVLRQHHMCSQMITAVRRMADLGCADICYPKHELQHSIATSNNSGV